MAQKLISLVVPILNEGENIPLIYSQLRDIFTGAAQEKYDYEIIFVNDGSQDGSQEILEKLTDKDNRVKYVQFSRNFGKEVAIAAGLRNASGDAVILIDADGQHPPKFIPKFLEKWENGAEVVVGLREKNNRSILRDFCSQIFYKLQNIISEVKLLSNETDYRLLDKRVVAEYNKFTERGRISRGLINWLGFKREHICFDCGDRKAGKSRFNYFALAKLAVSCFVSQSLFPLKLAGYLGIFITPSAGGLGLFMFADKYLLNNFFGFNFSGPAMLAVLIVFLVGIILICLGLIALYIANIQVEVMNRPMYVIRQTKNLYDRKQA